MNDFTDRDVVAVAAENKYGMGVVMRIRNGLLIGREKFNLVMSDSDDLAQIFAGFFVQYYRATNDIPPEILVESSFSDLQDCESWLKVKKGSSKKW